MFSCQGPFGAAQTPPPPVLGTSCPHAWARPASPGSSSRAPEMASTGSGPPGSLRHCVRAKAPTDRNAGKPLKVRSHVTRQLDEDAIF